MQHAHAGEDNGCRVHILSSAIIWLGIHRAGFISQIRWQFLHLIYAEFRARVFAIS
jgi:hypothetical protein